MKRILSIITLAVAAIVLALPAGAQKRDRDDFRKDIREYKHNFLRVKLDMSREQAAKFFEEYDRMEDAVTAINDEARAVEKKIYDAPDGTVTDIEYEMASKTLREAKAKEAAIETEYYGKFAEILTPRQMFELPKVERDFTMQLVKYRKKDHKK